MGAKVHKKLWWMCSNQISHNISVIGGKANRAFRISKKNYWTLLDRVWQKELLIFFTKVCLWRNSCIRSMVSNSMHLFYTKSLTLFMSVFWCGFHGFQEVFERFHADVTCSCVGKSVLLHRFYVHRHPKIMIRTDYSSFFTDRISIVGAADSSLISWKKSYKNKYCRMRPRQQAFVQDTENYFRKITSKNKSKTYHWNCLCTCH